MAGKTRNGRPERRLREQVMRDHAYVCWLCGHGGAQDCDEKFPRSRGGTYTYDNLAPAHGVDGCPTCGRKCNQEKSDKLVWSVPQHSRAW